MVTRSVWTDGRGGRTARQHNAFADTVGWQRLENVKISFTLLQFEAL